MSRTSPYRAELVGTGAYLPEAILTNHDIEKKVDTSDEWIVTRTGIRERRIADSGESSSDLAVNAARQAIDSANIKVDDIDMIILCTSTPDILFPATACFVQKKLGATRSAAYDISAVCSGFVFGISIAEQYIKSGRYQYILVIGSEVNSRIVDWSDRSTCILFGDGAGAVVLKRTESDIPRGVLSTHIYSDGNQAQLIGVPGAIGRSGFNSADVDNGQYFIKMDGNATFKTAVKRMCEVALEALQFNGLKLEDVSLMIPHQANKRIIDAVGKKLRFPPKKVFINIDKYGNTSAASIPIAIHEAKNSGRICSGDLILLLVVGAGLTWGAGLIRW